jgi:hypothetical protein
MKKFKIALLALLIVGGIGALFAFKSDRKTDKPLVQICFAYNGGTSTGDLQNPANYTTPAGNPTCGPTDDIPCVLCVESTNTALYNSSTQKPRVEAGTTLAAAIAAKQTSGTGFTISYKTAP